MEPITIFLAEGQRYVRDAMHLMFDHQADFSVIGETDSGEALAESVNGQFSNVILLDWYLPSLKPTETLQALRERHPESLIIATSVRPELADHIQQFDVDGFLSKQLSPDEFIDQLKELIEKKGKS
ncbi:MAG: response regulator [Anaerolineae bacterium]|jgi:DNA-binding NarL/FixJ family response regulator|nr:response regulator [Anaerolineae bacterium]